MAIAASVRARIEAILDGLIDYESDIRYALAKQVHSPNSVSEVCDALRWMLDDDEEPSQ